MVWKFLPLVEQCLTLLHKMRVHNRIGLRQWLVQPIPPGHQRKLLLSWNNGSTSYGPELTLVIVGIERKMQFELREV